ncbi:GATOR complex protein MIOS [Phlebotomus argentipes]|uniref:GATOR complex protein MIOS n=1 Tax=Phlebotomus argentipes TaxID=94469 RepID=UPI002893002A|nr:GATOR complex protein MIOS [Phlebotomus argentipes]
MSSIEGLQWYPRNPDYFYTWGCEMNVYKVDTSLRQNLSVTSNAYLDLSPCTHGVLQVTEPRYVYIRCTAPSYQPNSLLAAAGLVNGKAVLCNFLTHSDSSIEFTPKHSRACLCLAWSETETNLLAMGYDRNRSDHSIFVWDTSKDLSIVQQIGLSETAHSLCWDKSARVIYAGMSHKHIKVLDLRSGSSSVSTTSTRAIHGLCLAPGGRYLASYIDNNLTLWDVRNIEKSLSQRQTQKNINHVIWCPTRSSVLSILQRDSPFVHLLDLHWSGGSDMEGEPYTMKRYAAPFQSRILSGARNITIQHISWHPKDLERMLAVTGAGNVTDFQVPQRVAIAWDTKNNLWGSSGVRLDLQQFPANSPSVSGDSVADVTSNTDDDISAVIYRRALMDYGHGTDIQRNEELTQNPKLKSVWKLLAHMSRDDWAQGLKKKLGISNTPDVMQTMHRSEIINIPWQDFPSFGYIRVFRSEHRDFAQQLCGWTFDREREGTFSAFIDELMMRKEFTRAAFIAVVHLRVKYAIEILAKGADLATPEQANGFRMAAIALSGFNVEKGAIWRNQCAQAHAQISDPYLRAIFAFLAPDSSETYDMLLNETDISLSDRMGFACVFLSDQRLSDYVKSSIQTCIEKGDLNGVLLTGATNEGITLLQSHLDWTEDVQTVALIAVHFMPIDLIRDYRVQYWISSYQDLLNTWGLWEQRAQLDILLGAIRSPPRVSKSVFLMCSFCGKNVSGCIQEEVRSRTGTAHVNKLSSCPNCRKPLPRCALCLHHMGTTTGNAASQHLCGGHSALGWQSRPFSKWFSWCQTCRHGGHTEHLVQWFQQHSECPVTSCNCKCFAVDQPMPKFPTENLQAAHTA